MQARELETKRVAAAQQAQQLQAREFEAKRVATDQQARQLQAREFEAKRVAADQQARQLQAREFEAKRVAADQQARQLQARELEAKRVAEVQQAGKLVASGLEAKKKDWRDFLPEANKRLAQAKNEYKNVDLQANANRTRDLKQIQPRNLERITIDDQRRELKTKRVAPVELGPNGVPRQIFRTLEEPVGPAYRTFDEAFANKFKDTSHITENIVSIRGQEVARWWEVSESMAAKGVHGVGQLGHTEQKALLRVRLEPGTTLEIRGAHAPCPLGSGCDIAMQNAARTSGATIIYRTYNGLEVTYPRDF